MKNVTNLAKKIIGRKRVRMAEGVIGILLIVKAVLTMTVMSIVVATALVINEDQQGSIMRIEIFSFIMTLIGSILIMHSITSSIEESKQ